MEKKITQKLIDNIFSCLDGFGNLTYSLDGCKLIQKYIKEEHDIFLSVSECQRFWTWRSDLWDAGFLNVTDDERSKKEVLYYFQQWLDCQDCWEWA